MIATMKPRTTAQTLIKRMHAKQVAEEERAIQKRRLANDIRDLHNWVAVFTLEYDMPEEVTIKLHTRLEKMGERLAKL